MFSLRGCKGGAVVLVFQSDCSSETAFREVQVLPALLPSLTVATQYC